jgi:hypothetical protein
MRFAYFRGRRACHVTSVLRSFPNRSRAIALNSSPDALGIPSFMGKMR